MKQFISWRRVSTKKQGRSGLGLEAQEEIISHFVGIENGELVKDYCEVYTGTELSGCTELRKAIDHCKAIGATLIIAKSDRFRNTIEALKIYEEMGDGTIYFYVRKQHLTPRNHEERPLGEQMNCGARILERTAERP